MFIALLSLIFLILSPVGYFYGKKAADSYVSKRWRRQEREFRTQGRRQRMSDEDVQKAIDNELGSQPEASQLLPVAASAVSFMLFVFFMSMTSFIYVNDNEVAHLSRVYWGENMPPGQIIADEHQKGPQAKIIPPGFHYIPFVRFFYDVETLDQLVVPEGKYAVLVAKDGVPLREGQFLADEWKGNLNNFVDAEHFLGFKEDEEGNKIGGTGQQGPQLTVLPPATYRINRYLFEVKTGSALHVETGHVAVVRSNVQTASDEVCNAPTKRSITDLTAAIVPKGCIGVWDEALEPGAYYLNGLAYKVNSIPTRVQTWTYKGGYTKRTIDLKVDSQGVIKQTETPTKVSIPEDAADGAINVRVEGWTVPVDTRILVQVLDAPLVVASVGSLQKVEDFVVTPAIRDVLRTIGGMSGQGCKYDEKKKPFDCEVEPTRVMDFVTARDSIAKKAEAVVVPEAMKAGVRVVDVRLGEPAIPPELMVATLREQLATQLTETFKQEKIAQTERIKAEKERATADQQSTLVKAQIADQAAAFYKEQRKKEGEGEKLYLTQVAAGQKKQALVLGEDRVMLLQQYKMAIDAAKENPAMVKVPHTNVSGGSDMEGAAAILGAGNSLTNMLKNASTNVDMNVKPPMRVE